MKFSDFLSLLALSVSTLGFIYTNFEYNSYMTAQIMDMRTLYSPEGEEYVHGHILIANRGAASTAILRVFMVATEKEGISCSLFEQQPIDNFWAVWFKSNDNLRASAFDIKPLIIQPRSIQILETNIEDKKYYDIENGGHAKFCIGFVASSFGGDIFVRAFEIEREALNIWVVKEADKQHSKVLKITP